MRILIAILTYNAERHIASVLERIPESIWAGRNHHYGILILDDASSDETLKAIERYAPGALSKTPVYVGHNPINQGYGGNQKLAYRYAIDQGYDAVILLHGDGQYPPEMIEEMTTVMLQEKADAVLGSRMLEKKGALKGGMPFYKWIGNQMLTRIQNKILHSTLSEFHTGFRAYRTHALASIPFEANSNDFDFDTDILIQCLQTGKRIHEIAIPTRYGDEICHVNGVKYAFQCIRSCLLARMQRLSVFYRPKFDYPKTQPHYRDKTTFPSSHAWAIAQVPPSARVWEMGCGEGVYISAKLAQNNCIVLATDRFEQVNAPPGVTYQQLDLDKGELALGQNFSHILLLDVIEHLNEPEIFMAKLRMQLQADLPLVCITTPNIAFLPMRLLLLLGQFNYGKQGILDLTHKRLFTLRSLKRLLIEAGYKIERTEGIPVPFRLILPEGALCRLLTRTHLVLLRLSISLFAYQIAVTARPTPLLERTLKQANITPFTPSTPPFSS